MQAVVTERELEAGPTRGNARRRGSHREAFGAAPRIAVAPHNRRGRLAVHRRPLNRRTMVSIAFGGATILTMMGVVAIASKGMANLNLGFLEKYVHAIAGFIIAISGLSIQFLGL